MKEFKTKDLIKAQQKASDDSIRITKALGLSYYTVKNDFLYLINPDGSEEKIRKAVFGTKKTDIKTMKIRNDSKAF